MQSARLAESRRSQASENLQKRSVLERFNSLKMNICLVRRVQMCNKVLDEGRLVPDRVALIEGQGWVEQGVLKEVGCSIEKAVMKITYISKSLESLTNA